MASNYLKTHKYLSISDQLGYMGQPSFDKYETARISGWRREGLNVNSESSFNNFSLRKNSEVAGLDSAKKLEFTQDYFPRHKSIVRNKYVSTSK